MTPARSESPGPRQSKGFLLWHATLRWQRALREVLAPLELTHVQFVLLAALWWLTDVEKKTPSQKELAEYVGIDKMMTSQVLRALEKRGLIVRQSDQNDTRTRRLAVTKAGKQLAIKAIATVEAEDERFFQPADKLKGLEQILPALADVDHLFTE